MAATKGGFGPIIEKHKNLSENECRIICNNALQCFESDSEININLVNYLRQINLLVKFSKEDQSLPEGLLHELVKVITGSNLAAQGQEKLSLIHHAVMVLSSSILQQVYPGDTSAKFTPNVEPRSENIAALLAVVFAQGRNQGNLAKLVSQMVRWVSTVGFDYQVQCCALHYLVHTASFYRDLLVEDQVFVVSSQLSDWLSKASIEQMPNPLSKQKKSKPELVVEIDGGDCDEFFTILSLSSYYSPDQLMNIHTFSALRTWLQVTFMNDFKAMEQEAKSLAEKAERTESLEQSSKTVKKFSKRAKQALLDKACEYCLRVIDQSSRRPTKSQDSDLIHACATEAILILDLLCILDPTLIKKLFPAIKTFHSQMMEGVLNYPRAVLAALQFFINYSQNVVFNPQAAMEAFFDNIISSQFMEPFFAFDVISFLSNNLEKLCYKTLILEQFFPNLLKILAWNPRTYLADFLEILPAMTSQTTAIEMFHTLLDLPCTTAALELHKRADLMIANANLVDLKPDWAKSVELMKKPENKPWFNFVLRVKGGQGDTINKLEVLHSLLASLTSHPRVLYTAEAVLVLLRIYFDTVIESADYDLMIHLVPIIIERTSLIYNIPGYAQEVHKILAEELLAIFKEHPALIVDLQRELLECFSTPKNMEQREHVFIQLVWMVGEYTSTQHDNRCNSEIINKYYETLEALFYESAMTLQASEQQMQISSVELLATMMSCLAKLASRSQNLIPRVILCLTKVSQQMGKSSNIGQEEKAILASRATEYVNLLKFPDIAGVILSPPKDISSSHLHKDIHSSSVLLMRAAVHLIE
ncbi:AP-5 complex subunit zeta-1 [Holothuria leucospilota]|uniref:AP-5 complex subunit zeta-1 n=1 Tax=Holothuria leucospilota TaxID=206669 RepID=A0A9Q1C226_HOLLE|nr:AP-5 complex subunit zeta-1 [Holothuria leucospilota]